MNKRKNKQRVRISSVPKKNIEEIMKRDIQEREKLGEVDPTLPVRPTGTQFSNKDFEEMKHLAESLNKGELPQSSVLRYKELVKQFNTWKSFIEQEKEYHRLKELYSSTKVDSQSAETSTTNQNSGQQITTKDFTFYTERNPNIKSKPPFYGATLGISVCSTWPTKKMVIELISSAGTIHSLLGHNHFSLSSSSLPPPPPPLAPFLLLPPPPFSCFISVHF